MTDHLTEDRINDLIDGQLTATADDEAQAHLAQCAACREQAARLRLLTMDVGALPRSILPSRDLWPTVRAELARRGAPAPAAMPARRPRWVVRSLLAAAAVVAVMLSLAVGRHLAGDRERELATHAAPVAPLPASLVAVERDYARAASDLRASLEARHGSLRPETIAEVERSLAIIDGAIAEARAALLRDPANQLLAEMLAASYGRKLDLLRRATELPSRT